MLMEIPTQFYEEMRVQNKCVLLLQIKKKYILQNCVIIKLIIQ